MLLPDSPDGGGRVLGPGVLGQHHLGLVLQVLDLWGVLQAAGVCNGRYSRW